MATDSDVESVFAGREERSPLKKVQYFLHLYPTTIPFLVLLIGIVVFGVVVGDRFFHPFNLSLVLQQVTVIALLAVGQTMVILVAGIDLSVGAIMVLSSVVMGRFAVVMGWPPELALMAGLAVGAACGFLNGLLITSLRLPPFIVTLGTWSIFESINFLYSKNETLRQQDVEAVAPLLQFTGHSIRLTDIIPLDFLRGGVLTFGSVLMIFVAIVVSYVLTRTMFGRHVYASGDDPEAARLVGINVRFTLLKVYTCAGLICGFAGWVLIGRIGAVSPNAGYNANLDSITAVVIGGTSLFGGRGAIIGTLFGALIVGIFRNGLALAGLQNNWQNLTVGALIIVAVALDQWIRRVSV
ncbi:ABC transporter permease [Acuticoccus sp. M5D2P5]|uniref:ABC transporter permease n=1 Tax=Acuticoccus kalidii TaxID=2910977 RepID=UPI001F3DFE04|nr:ABC transporter permease [Acuticoccus kalidii]MCF3936738.1 ABC transporter permease [Acuticoccus kalidii]